MRFLRTLIHDTGEVAPTWLDILPLAQDLHGLLGGGSGFVSGGSAAGHTSQGSPCSLVWLGVLEPPGVGWGVVVQLVPLL